MRKHVFTLCSLLFVLSLSPSGAETADELRKKCRFHGGIIVHLDANGSKLSAELAKGDNVMLQVLDASGRICFDTTNPGGMLDMSNFDSGRYMVVIEADGQRAVKAVVKQ